MSADDTTGAEANPLVVPDKSASEKKVGGALPWWGDLHGQSGETVGAGTIDSYFKFARDRAFLDFVGHQANDLQITPELWATIRRATNGSNVHGRFAAILGWEWSANTAAGGDHNVYLPGGDGPLLRSSTLLAGTAKAEYPRLEQLHAGLREAEPDAMVVPHVGGRRASLERHAADLEPVVEVLSEWGEFEWFQREALDRGYRVGFVCGSDDHKGRPGAGHPGRSSFGVYGGLTCVLSPSLDRRSILAALRHRRCYGTNGPRIAISASCAGHQIGAAFGAAAPPPVKVIVAGTAPIENVVLLRTGEEVARHPADPTRSSRTLRISWKGARNRDRQRPLVWDGTVEITDGVFGDARGWAFDTPAEGLHFASSHKLAWRSVTTGDEDGLLVDVDGDDEAVLTFATPPIECAIRLGDVRRGMVSHPGPGVDTLVSFEMAPAGIGRDVSAVLQDPDPPESGCHPYWIRVRQVDGAKAWVSPFFITIDESSG